MAMTGIKQVKKAITTIDDYLETVPEPHRSTLSKVRAVIRSAVPAAAEETISWGMPAFKYKGQLVGFAAFKNHCSFFPMSGTLINDYQDELARYTTSKGTIQFPADKPLPATLIRKLVKARVAQNETKKSR